MTFQVPVKKLHLICDSVLAVERPTVTKPYMAVGLIRAFLRTAFCEVLVAVTLDTQNKIISVIPIQEGDIDHILVSSRKVFTKVLAEQNAAGFILAHNHPSGDPRPSPEDLRFMRLIRVVGRELDCELKDFIVLGSQSEEYWSARNDNYEL